MSERAEKDLIVYRLEQASNALEEARVLRSTGHLQGTVNRAYYSMFYAVQALLVRKGLRSSKHTGTMSLFDREFVRTGIFDKSFSKWLHDLFDLRQDADYSDLFVVTEEHADAAIEHAEAFLKRARATLAQRL